MKLSYWPGSIKVTYKKPLFINNVEWTVCLLQVFNTSWYDDHWNLIFMMNAHDAMVSLYHLIKTHLLVKRFMYNRAFSCKAVSYEVINRFSKLYKLLHCAVFIAWSVRICTLNETHFVKNYSSWIQKDFIMQIYLWGEITLR